MMMMMMMMMLAPYRLLGAKQKRLVAQKLKPSILVHTMSSIVRFSKFCSFIVFFWFHLKFIYFMFTYIQEKWNTITNASATGEVSQSHCTLHAHVFSRGTSAQHGIRGLTPARLNGPPCTKSKSSRWVRLYLTDAYCVLPCFCEWSNLLFVWELRCL